MAEISKVIGLMSGTSLDGVDAALIETDGEHMVRPLAGLTIPYGEETRALLRAALQEARGVAEGAPVPYSIRDAERLREVIDPNKSDRNSAAGRFDRSLVVLCSTPVRDDRLGRETNVEA